MAKKEKKSNKKFVYKTKKEITGDKSEKKISKKEGNSSPEADEKEENELDILSGQVKEPPSDHINNSDKDKDLKELIEKNIKWSQVIYEQNRKIKHRLTMMVVGNYLRLLLIIAPIVLGFIFLPPLLEDIFGQYGNILGGVSPLGVVGEGNQIGDIMSQFSGEQIQDIIRVIQK